MGCLTGAVGMVVVISQAPTTMAEPGSDFLFSQYAFFSTGDLARVLLQIVSTLRH